MENFNFINVLEMSFLWIIDANFLAKTIRDDRCFNPNLTKLKIYEFPCEELLLRKLISIYSSGPFITVSQFKIILNGFRKIKSLGFCFRMWELTEDYFDCIREHKNNLPSITLAFLPSTAD